MKKTARLFGFFILLYSLMSLPVASAQKPATSTQKDGALLDQSYNLSQVLGGREQLFYLVELCRVTPDLHLSVEKAKEYSLALFRVASTEQDIELRAVGQKNAVTCLSSVDPVAAMDLLQKINFQPPGSGKWLYEDPRYNAAEQVFVNLFAKFKSEALDNIAAKARYLGQTGQYPYLGIARVIESLPTSSENALNTFLSDAVGFYATETGFYNRDQEFLLLLQSLKVPPVNKDLAARAVATFVQRLKNDPVRLPGDYYAEIHITSNGKVFPFTDRNEAFLFQAFPQIKRFNPTLATQLRHQDPKLDEAMDKMTYISGGFVQGDPTSAQATRQHLQWLQESLLNRVKDCQDSNPQAAARFAQRLTDLNSRILGFSAAIPGIARSNPSEARSMYEKHLSELGNLEDFDRLRAMVALAPAAYHLRDSRQYESLTAQALDLGAQLFNSDVKAARVKRHEGFNELQDLVTFAASQPKDVLPAKVQHLPDGWLKAYLLMYEAEGHAKRNAPPAAPAACPE